MKILSLALLTMGVICIIVGSLDELNVISLEVIDSSPPKFIMTYPFDQAYVYTVDFNQVVAYVVEQESELSFVVYHDNYISVTLETRPYTELSIVPTIYKRGKVCKYPDVNKDGVVNEADADLINTQFGYNSSNPDFNEEYDLYPDGLIDIEDISIVGSYDGTYSLGADIALITLTTSPMNITFEFYAANICGAHSSISGSYLASDTEIPKIPGEWYIDDILVQDGYVLNITKTNIEVKFVCTDISLVEVFSNMRVIVNGETIYLQNITETTWSANVTLIPGTNTLKLIAGGIVAGRLANNNAQIVIDVKQQTISAGKLLILLGVILICSAVVIERKL